MWIDNENYSLTVPDLTEQWALTECQEDASDKNIAGNIFNIDEGFGGDGMSIIHRTLGKYPQLSPVQEKQFFESLGLLIKKILVELLKTETGRSDVFLLIASILENKKPLSMGLSTQDHRLLMTEFKHLKDSLADSDFEKKLSISFKTAADNRLYLANEGSVVTGHIAGLDWPYRLVIALAQKQFKSLIGDHSTELHKALTKFISTLSPVAYIPEKITELKQITQHNQLLIGQYFQQRNYLVNHNLRLVYHVANKYTDSAIDIQETLQDGVFGLIRAIEKYRPATGYRFSTYAYNWIEAKVRLTATRQKGFMRLPSSAVADLTTVRKIASSLTKAGLTASPELVSKNCDLSLDRVSTLMSLKNYASSIDQPLSGGNDEINLSGLLGNDKNIVVNQVAGITLKEDIDYLLQSLDQREAYILINRYGLNGVPAQALETISHSVGLSRERVRQIEKKLLKDLRLSLEESGRSTDMLAYMDET
ncbi:MAG: RNA polymerase nonessential primary-like sigma factor [Pseudohongiellaceae bacterium]|jgi:RNA polymerase nonessential primary-like sigma factor